MKRLSDYVIVSDVDGTLLPYGGELPERNIEAIKRFTEKGGRFAIATGRSKELTEGFVKRLPVNTPCIVYNGSAIYDFNKGEFLTRYYLPESAKDYVAAILRDFPDIPAMVISGEHYYLINVEAGNGNFAAAITEMARYSDIETLRTAPWFKSIFSVPEHDRNKFKAYISPENLIDGIRFVNTNESQFEMLPKFSNKGFAMKRLVELGYVLQENIAAIGDFDNDLEMLEFAGFAAATQEAPDSLKAVADFVTGPSTLGAVADLVEYLESITE